MKKGPILLSVLLWSIYLSAQQDIKLPGIVVEQNSKYRTGSVKYLSNAEVKSAGAAPQRSDDKGQFTLVFADRPGGDVARIFAAKSGYEVVNEEEMKQASVIGRLQPLKIVMCEQGKLYDNQIAYYNIARDASLEAYKRKVAALQKDGLEQQRLIAELRVQFNQDIKTKEEAIALLDKQRENAEKQAKELADKFVTENLDDQSPAYQRAFAAFEAKNIERAKAILDSVDLEKRLALNSSAKAKEKTLVDNLQKNIAKREEEIRQDVNMCLFKARLHKLDYEWADAERFYDLAIAYDSSNYEVAFEVAHYMQYQNQFAKARAYYEKTLTITSQPFEKSAVLNNLGALFYANNEMGGAKKAFEEALQIDRKLAQKNPDVFLPDVASALNNLGVLLQANNEMKGAKQAYEEALQITRQLANKNPDVYRPDLATYLNNLGTLLRANNEMGGAKKAHEEALQIRRKLAQKNPDVYQPDVATTLNNLGNLLKDNNEMGGAKKAYEEALQIYRKLAEKNPNVFLPHVATTLNNLGNLLKDNNEMGGAKQAFEEALLIRRKLAQKNPDVFLPDVASTLNNLGNLLADNKEMGGAKQAFEEALLIRRKLAQKNPDVFLPDVASTLNNLGNLLADNKEMGAAKKAFEEALQIYRQLAEKNPDVYRPYVAGTLNNLAVLLSATNEMGGAKKAYEEALQIRRKLAEKNPEVYLPDVAMALNNLGEWFRVTNELGGAKKAFEEALQLYRKLAEKNPDVYLPDLARTLNNLGNLLQANNEMGGAKKAFEEALQIRRKLAEKKTDVYLPDVARTLNNLGILLKDNNEMAGAKKAYEEALLIRRKLAEKNPEVYMPDVAMTLNNLGALLSDNNEMGEAKKAFEEALLIRRKLAEKNPWAYNLDVAMTDINISLFYEQILKSRGEMSLKAAGLELMLDAEQRLANFPEAHPQVQQYKPYIQRLTQFFKNFDEAAFQLQQQINRLNALETANKTEKDPHRKVQQQKEIIGILSEIEKAMPGNKEVAKRMAARYGSLAWYQLFTQQFTEAEQSARTGLAKAPGEEWSNAKLALALLYQGKWEAAREIYLSLKDKKYGERTYKDTFLADLKELEQAGISHPDVKKVRALLGGK